MQKIAPFLMFSGAQAGKAEEAVRLYVSLFPDSEVLSIERFQPGEPGGAEGQVKQARFRVAGLECRALDSAYPHAFGFTPSLSLFVTCASVDELNRLFAALSADGAVLMPPGNYGFSQYFTWLSDRYGVSWQLNVE